MATEIRTSREQVGSVDAGIFVTGTDTEVGKTRVSVWLARELARRGYQVGTCKPAVSGAIDSLDSEGKLHRIWEDAEALKGVCTVSVPEEWISPYRWLAPLAPPVAAQFTQSEGEWVERDPGNPENALPTLTDFVKVLDRWSGACDILVAEGVGGLLCPLTATETVADLARSWGRPVLLVSRLGLGALNHTLLTLEVARQYGLQVVGVLLNCTTPRTGSLAEATNPRELAKRISVPVWGPIEHHPLSGDNEVPPAIVAAIDALGFATKTQ